MTPSSESPALAEVIEPISAANEVKEMNRYPGLKPFVNDEDIIFFGRNNEVDILVSSIRVNNTFILYGKSGLGKSSLARAGLIPKLKMENITPVIIRFFNSSERQDGTKEDPVSIIEGEIRNATNYNGSGTVLLIFDQFEEFLYYNKSTRDQTLQFLHSLSNTATRDIKLLFLIRSDKFYLMNEVSQRFPGILNNKYELKPLLKEKAEKAIELPAQINASRRENLSFKSPRFKYDLDALRLILSTLSDENREIECSQLQIVCQEIEEIAAKKRAKIEDKGTAIVITTADFKGEEGLKEILNNFYKKQLEKLQNDKELSLSDKDMTLVKMLIEDELMSGNKRVIQSEARVREFLKKVKPGVSLINDKDKIDVIIDRLLDLRLIREDNSHLGKVYEISHDTLLEAIIKSRDNRVKYESGKKLQRRFLVIAIPVFIGLIVALVISSNLRNKHLINQQSPYLIAAAKLMYKNPTLSYIIARQGKEIYEGNNALNSLIDSIDNNNLLSIVNRTIFSQNINNVFFDRDSVFVVTSSDLYLLRPNGKFVSAYNFNNTIVNAFKLRDTVYYVENAKGILEDTNYLRRADGNTVAKFITGRLPRTLAVSSDHKFILAGRYIFKSDSLEAVAELEGIEDFKDLMCAAFTNDNKYLVAGFWSGDLVVYNLEGKVLRSFQGGNFNSVVSALAITSDDKYAVAGDRENNIYIWELEELDSLKPRETLVSVKDPFRKLTGHSGPVNSIAISSNNKMILSGSSDNNAILWNFQGQLLSVLRGHTGEVAKVEFSGDGSKIVTNTETGEILQWEKKNVSELYKNNHLAEFGPFEYYSVGVEKPTEKGSVDKNNLENRVLLALNYSGSLPAQNIFPEDKMYLQSLSRSIADTRSRFTDVFKDSLFNNLSGSLKRLIYLAFAKFNYKAPELLLQTERETKKEREDRKFCYDSLALKAYLVDTSSFGSCSNFVISGLDGIVSRHFTDTVLNPELTYKYADLITNFYTAYLKKYPKDSAVAYRVAGNYSTIALTLFYGGNYAKAETLQRHVLGIHANSPEYLKESINIGLIRIFLATDRMDDAKKLFHELLNYSKISDRYRERTITAFLEKKKWTKSKLNKVLVKEDILESTGVMKRKGIKVKNAEEFEKYLEKVVPFSLD